MMMPRILIPLLLGDERELGRDDDLIGQRAAAGGQRGVPLDAVVAAVDARGRR
jgi:hypothetical protein